MPDRYIERKGIIFDEIEEKGDMDQVARLQRENRKFMKKVERLDGEYRKIRKALEFVKIILFIR